MSLLHINSKVCMGSLMLCLHFAFSDLERSMWRSLRFGRLVSHEFLIAICHTNCRCQAKRQGPWTSCVVISSLLRSPSLTFWLRMMFECLWKLWMRIVVVVTFREFFLRQPLTSTKGFSKCHVITIFYWMPGSRSISEWKPEVVTSFYTRKK